MNLSKLASAKQRFSHTAVPSTQAKVPSFRKSVSPMYAPSGSVRVAKASYIIKVTCFCYWWKHIDILHTKFNLIALKLFWAPGVRNVFLCDLLCLVFYGGKGSAKPDARGECDQVVCWARCKVETLVPNLQPVASASCRSGGCCCRCCGCCGRGSRGCGWCSCGWCGGCCCCGRTNTTPRVGLLKRARRV